MARHRQRARDRKSEQPQQPQQQQQPRRENVPDDWEHGSAEVDLAEAAIIAGAGGQPAGLEDDEDGGAGGPPARPVAREDEEPEPEPEPAERRISPGPRPGGNRVGNFLRASWAELQRVQWPDRRQVAQATAVVLGFVAIAGAYLGVADAVAQKIVDFIL